MVRFQLDEKWISGNRTVDSAHGQIIELMNIISEGTERKDVARDFLLKLLHYVTNLIEEHCDEEEKTMEQVNYSGFERHRSEHERLKSNLHRYLSEFEKYPRGDAKLFLDFLCTYTEGHLMNYDRQFIEYLKVRTSR